MGEQLESMVFTYGLENFLDDSLPVPPKFVAFATSPNETVINPVLTSWNQTNNLLKSQTNNLLKSQTNNLLKSRIYNSVTGNMLS